MTEVTSPFDLNVLSTPPAFILSQDQTLDSFVLNEAVAPFNLLTELDIALFTFLEFHSS